MIDKFSKREKKGYTLIEMLVAVGILIVICAIAIPAVAGLRRSLEITKYDDVARQIYLVSQNKLTTMKTVGTLNTFCENIVKDEDYSERKLGFIGKEPQDFDGETDDWKKLYYFTDTDTVFIDYIIGNDSILNASLETGGHYLVELNPETGDVYGVFYGEEMFTYDDIMALASRGKSDRKEKMIGYYGGISELSQGIGLPDKFEPAVKVVNKEDLYLDIECSGMRKLIKNPENILLSVTITDERFRPDDTSNHSFTIELKGGRDFWISNDKAKVQVLLDSVRGGMESFQNITRGKLTPGDNITATVTITYAREGLTVTGSAVAPVTNSLFASKDVDENLAVSSVRHLNNLRSSNYSATGKDGLIITQTGAIDYDYSKWPAGSMISSYDIKKNPPYSDTFAPIANPSLFDRITFNGNNNELRNFNIAGTNNIGLFSQLKDCAFMNMKLVDFSVSGSAYVGALAGQMQGGSITNCGVYLTTRDEYNRPLTDMGDRVARYRVSGTDYVGGLVGRISGATITKASFAAMNVAGNAYVGGFCGEYSNGQIFNSYASGKVNATGSYAGGFAGRTANTSMNSCYSTSDVTAQWYAGGLVGSAANGTISDCSAYGLVQRGDSLIDKATSGGFAGTSTATFRNCKFLRQANYNYDYTISFADVLPKGFPDLKVSGNLDSNCYPYSDALVGNPIPFVMVHREDGTILPHYGDWPAELKLQTSLVYYERYANADAEGSYYGYYAETSLMAEGDSFDTGGINSWKLNTLRQEPCVEDGYAIMTIYSLTKFNYCLNLKDNATADEKTAATKVVNITDTQSAGTAKRITDKVSLQFSNTADGARYTISNAKVFRLPFALQMTDRNTAARFYDRLTITGYIDEKAVFENYTFFYCPDFAKNAINPDISTTAAAVPKNPTGESRPISVRSPRHINALARAAYYWNTTKWTDSRDTRYYYRQENDIDFGTYTKTYCGISYNLMDTASGNAYRNRPIGRPNSQAFTDPTGATYTPSNFRNVYDGQGYEIIDYRCVTTNEDRYQFTGLFGEVQGASLKNIVMVASDPENKSGYVISEYNDGSHHPGVGALAGLVYVGKKDSDDNEQYRNDDTYSYASVKNCSVTGYTVSYAPKSNAKLPCAVGGLVGYNFGRIENSSAVSKLVTADRSSNVARFIGGLVGSINGRGTITNCYSGGIVSASDSSSSNTYLAGICAGFDNIYGIYDNQATSRNMVITNVYSYCTWDNDKYPIRGVPYAVINKQDKLKLYNGYYLTNTVGTGVTLNGTVAGGDFSVYKLNYSQLCALSIPASKDSATGVDARGSGRATSGNTYPWSSSLDSVAYSYPALVINPREKTTTYVHYGDWYYESTKKDSGYLTYYELYSDGTFATSYINEKNALAYVGSFDTTNSKTIESAGYGILRLLEDAGTFKANGQTLQLGSILKNNIAVGRGIYNLFSLNDESLGLLNPENNLISKELQFGYDETEDSMRTPRTRTIHVNGAFADTLSTSALQASPEAPLKVRTAQQLQNMTSASSGWNIKLDHDVVAGVNTGGIHNAGYTFDGGYISGGNARVFNGYKTGSNGNRIFGLTKPLFDIIAINGDVKNLALVGINMSSSTDGLAAVAKTNNGDIQNCLATGTITTNTTNLGSAGMVGQNFGTISNSYVNVAISSGKGEAAGFVLRNSGTINNCYALGQVQSANAVASGFIGKTSSGSNVQSCYTLANIYGTQSYGFVPTGSTGITTASCYWAKDKTINNAITNSGGTSKSLTQLKTVFTSGAWTTSNTSATWSNTMSGAYPYPRLSALDHCGDWPVGISGKVGAIKLYRSGGNYYANGIMVSLEDMSQGNLYAQGSAMYNYFGYPYYSNRYAYGIVFDSDFAQDLSNWEAKYTYSYNYFGWRWGEDTINLSTVSEGNLRNSNANGLTLNVFWVTNGYYLDEVILRNKTDGTVHVFVYNNNTFTYQP
ncbi:GLUG motif-containing protein [Anaerotignum propionicum]|uniref:Type II secretory pathway, pseudopilin PulG n=2 Tax=Anaerotignum propionicum TaxID=28446 RepID=A0AA94HZ91_ANAPI|nr:GLUG motif-containing protein [Anaerotignum propionicum]SHE83904.1 Type II secretory pathway, pseudopilin PulG [[Clostridium] propionicum DSM 1682] [Anaerotignum propionicum DSM 1682]